MEPAGDKTESKTGSLEPELGLLLEPRHLSPSEMQAHVEKIHRMFSSFGSSVLTPESLGQKLYDYCSSLTPCLMFSPARARNLVRALIIFVAYHPPSVAAKLFNKQRIEQEPIKDVYLYKMEYKETRHWKYIVSKMTDLTSLEQQPREDPLIESELYRLGSIKTTANSLTRFVAYHATEGSPNLFSAMIGYWIVKLYEVSFYRAKPRDLPQPLPTLFTRFVTWYGKRWRSKAPMFAFDPHMFASREEMLSFFPFMKETSPIQLPLTPEADCYEKRVLEFWGLLGEQCLSDYLLGADLDFVTFYQGYVADKLLESVSNPEEHAKWLEISKQLQTAHGLIEQLDDELDKVMTLSVGVPNVSGVRGQERRLMKKRSKLFLSGS